MLLMCRVLEVARSGFYAWVKSVPSARARTDERLRVEVRAIHEMSRGRYGSPRIHAELQERGERVSRKRVARLMSQDRGGACERRKRHEQTPLTLLTLREASSFCGFGMRE